MEPKKYFIIPLLVVCLLSVVACSKLDKLTQFRLSYTSEVTVPSSLPVTLPVDLLTPPLATNSESAFESNNTTKKLVKEIYLENVDIRVESPANGDLGFVSSIHVYIQADNLPEKLLAFREDIADEAGRELALDTSDDDFIAYITGESYSLRVNVVSDELVSEDRVIAVRSVFLVKAGVNRD